MNHDDRLLESPDDCFRGLASRSQHLWFGGGYKRFAEASHDRRPDTISWSAVLPPSKQDEPDVVVVLGSGVVGGLLCGLPARTYLRANGPLVCEEDKRRGAKSSSCC